MVLGAGERRQQILRRVRDSEKVVGLRESQSWKNQMVRLGVLKGVNEK